MVIPITHSQLSQLIKTECLSLDLPHLKTLRIGEIIRIAFGTDAEVLCLVVNVSTTGRVDLRAGGIVSNLCASRKV